MAEFDFRDIYIGSPDQPKFVVNQIIVDDIIRVIVQKYEMIIFTNQGELLGDPNFGADLPRLLFQTKVSATAVKNLISQQIDTYITELNGTSYGLDVSFQQDPENYQDMMFITFTIADYEIFAIIS